MNPLLGLRSPRSGNRARADRTIDREYEALRDTVLRVTSSKLRQIDIALDPGDLEAAYNQAWHALYQRLAQGAEIENRTGFLVTTAFRRAIDEHRAARTDRYLELPEDAPAAEDDLAQQLDDQHRLRALRAGMRERLDDRELRAATLCYLHGCTRREAAEILGVSPRRMEKVMDRVSKRMSELAADVEDDWCEQQRSLIQAYALGVLDRDGERYPLAVAHLKDCSACRRRVLMLRGLGAVAPPVPLFLAGGASVQGGAAPSGDRAEVGAGTAAGGGRAALNAPAIAATAAVAVVAVTIGVVLLVDRDDPPPTTAPSATAPVAPASAPSGATTVAERERAAEQRRARAARERAKRRRAERVRARRAAAAATTAAAAAAGGATEPASASPATSPPTGSAASGSGTTSGSSGSASSSGSGSSPGSGTGSGSSSGAGAASGSSGSAGADTDVVTDGAEEFDLGD